MPDNTYVMTEIVGVSEDSTREAIANAITRAKQTLKGLAWFEVKQVRGNIVDGKVSQYQVVLDVGFRYLTDDEMKSWVNE